VLAVCAKSETFGDPQATGPEPRLTQETRGHLA
jgi:hypothetical protein